MDVSQISREIWTELRRYINTVDRAEAAETLVSVLIDNDVDADEIKDVFKSDSEVKAALTHYLKDHEEEPEDDEDNDDDEEFYEEDY